MREERDADFWHLPGTDDLNYIKAQPAPVVVRVLTKRGKENRQQMTGYERPTVIGKPGHPSRSQSARCSR